MKKEQESMKIASCSRYYPSDWSLFRRCIDRYLGFLRGSDDKESACNAGDSGLIPGSGRYPGEENVNPLQYYCLENSMDRGAWQVNSPWGHKESYTTETFTTTTTSIGTDVSRTVLSDSF